MSTTTYELSVKPRSEFGKNASRRARKAGMIPAVVYSHGKEGTALFVDSSEWAVLSNHDFNLVTLINGRKKTAALVKEVQVNYLKSQVVHIDFQEVSANEAISTSVPVHASIGEAAGIAQGGMLEQAVHEVEVKCLPSKLPESIEVDVSGLELDQSIHVKEIELPEGVELISDGELVVFAVVKPAAEASAEATAGEGEEGEEVAEGEETAE
ncbi:50S ribosomal protein L25 [Lentisphaerota bacterium ZTH]|nr:50S ribosomal protein L25 [Lentisphaerota bacterium]WET06561.1 50S ribosomal protein L25 [Lentisphaerota bacterium ZTH]